MDFGWFGATRRRREETENRIQLLEGRIRELDAACREQRNRIESLESRNQALESRIESGQAALGQLDAHIEQLRSAGMETNRMLPQFARNRRVDLVDFGPIRVFMYVDDLAYTQLADRWRNHKPDAGRRKGPYEETTPERCWQSDRSGLVALLVSHYAMERLDFHYLDIGCQYGTSAINASRLIQSLGLNSKVHAFDCGVAAHLTPYNVKLNHAEGGVVFNRLAVCGASHPVIVFTELNHSENNRVVNRMPQNEVLSYVVDGTSIDDYLRGVRKTSHVIAKIDTQGGEVEVLKGMEETIRNRFCTLIAEFVPHAVVTRVEPAAWLAGLCQEFHVLDVGEQDFYRGPVHPLPRIEIGQAETFVQTVDEKPSRHTDLLLIPKKLPNAEGLLDRVSPASVSRTVSAL